jgi:hypothetical protein
MYQIQAVNDCLLPLKDPKSIISRGSGGIEIVAHTLAQEERVTIKA